MIPLMPEYELLHQFIKGKKDLKKSIDQGNKKKLRNSKEKNQEDTAASCN